MHLFAALVPPRHVLDEIETVVDQVEEIATASVPHPEARVHRRAGTTGRRPEHGQAPSGPQLNRIRVDRMLVPITKFGNVPLTEANRLKSALGNAAQDWQAPRLRFSGGAALEWPGDECAWVKLGGDPQDLEALRAVASGVQRVSQGLQLFVDRRIWRPMLEVGTINRLTTPDYLERLMDALDAHTGSAWWQTELSLFIPSVSGPSAPHKLFAEIPLGPAVPH